MGLLPTAFLAHACFRESEGPRLAALDPRVQQLEAEVRQLRSGAPASASHPPPSAPLASASSLPAIPSGVVGPEVAEAMLQKGRREHLARQAKSQQVQQQWLQEQAQQRQKLDAIFQREPLDSSWSKKASEKLGAFLRSNNVVALSVDCRFSFCRVDLGPGNGAAATRAVTSFTLVEGEGSSSSQFFQDETGQGLRYMYFSRPGFGIPTEPGRVRPE